MYWLLVLLTCILMVSVRKFIDVGVLKSRNKFALTAPTLSVLELEV